jgi:hypothetical protein
VGQGGWASIFDFGSIQLESTFYTAITQARGFTNRWLFILEKVSRFNGVRPESVYLWNNGFGSRAGYLVAGKARVFYITILPVGNWPKLMVYHYYSREQVAGRAALRVRPGFV